MDRNQAKELLPIVQAYAEGKNIQYNSVTSGWCDITESEGLPMGFLEEKPSYFRIKKEFIYRPFANAEECWAEMLEHQPFGWIHVTDDNLYHNIIMLAPEIGCHEAYIRIGNCTVRGLEETFRIATFADGQPFGVKIEEG